MSYRRKSFKEHFVVLLSSILLRFYNEIIAGVWSILVFLPLDSYLNRIVNGKPSYNITTNFWFFFALYTVFFLISASAVPYIKAWYVNRELDILEKSRKITYFQKKKIRHVISHVLVYKSIFSREGLLQFFMSNLFAFGVILAYFGIEGMIANIMNDESLIVPVIFLIFFLLLLILESFFDDYLSQEMRSHYAKHSNANIAEGNKKLLTLILRNLGGGGSLSANFGQILVEDAVDDIYEILEISSANGGSKSGTIKKLIRSKNRFTDKNGEKGERKKSSNTKQKRSKNKRKENSGVIKNY
jgi:hypothetical protein